MPKFKMFVFTNPASPESEAGYNTWYDNQHIPDVCRIDGFNGAQRFKAVDVGMGDTPAQYVAIYEMEANNAKAAIDNLQSKAGTDEMVMSDDIDLDNATIMVYEQVTEPYSV